MSKLAQARKATSDYFTQPVVKVLARTPVTPNTITWLGFWVTVVAAVLVVTGNLFAAGFVVLFAGFFDMLDGALARLTNKTSSFGAALDSTLDRLSEAVLLLAVMVQYTQHQSYWYVLLAGAALIGSFMVSYIRARAEGLGLQLLEGFFTRADRVVVLALGLLLSQINGILAIALGIIAVLSFVTAGQRLFLVWQKTRK